MVILQGIFLQAYEENTSSSSFSVSYIEQAESISAKSYISNDKCKKITVPSMKQ